MKSNRFESLASFSSYIFLQISTKAQWLDSKKKFLKENWNLSWEKNHLFTRSFDRSIVKFLSVTWAAFTVVKYYSKISNIYHQIKFWKSLMNRCSIKKLFLKILQYSQENTCVGVPFFNENAGLQSCKFKKERLQRRCFNVNITKFLRAPALAAVWTFSYMNK